MLLGGDLLVGGVMGSWLDGRAVRRSVLDGLDLRLHGYLPVDELWSRCGSLDLDVWDGRPSNGCFGRSLCWLDLWCLGKLSGFRLGINCTQLRRGLHLLDLRENRTGH